MNPKGIVRYGYSGFILQQEACRKNISFSNLEVERDKKFSFVYPYTKLLQPIKLVIPSVYLDIYCWVLFNKYQNTNKNTNFQVGTFIFTNSHTDINKFPPLKIKISYVNIRDIPITKKFEINLIEESFTTGLGDIIPIHSHKLYAEVIQIK